ncbi:MAG: NDP-sugar synthase [bacterium]
MKIIGLIPAAGTAKRIAPLPCSKELFPIGFQNSTATGAQIPKTVCHYLLEKMRFAGVKNAYIVLRKGKWDIPEYFGDGNELDMNLAYLIMNRPFGAPFTLDQAYQFVKDAQVLFGFPDILFQPEEAFVRLLKKLADSNAEVVLGLFPTDHPQKMDMVEMTPDGQICRIEIKPMQTHLKYTWIIAVWTQVFTRFLHTYLKEVGMVESKTNKNHDADLSNEWYVGDVIQAALEDGMRIEAVTFRDAKYIDIGTPADLARAVHVWNPKKETLNDNR